MTLAKVIGFFIAVIGICFGLFFTVAMLGFLAAYWARQRTRGAKATLP